MFDEVAERYKESLERNHRFIPGDVEFYSEYKVRIAADINTGQSVSILDYGCGVGLSLPHLKEYFPDSRIHAHDPSIKSIEVAQKNYDYVNFDISQGNFDLIFVAGVMHHIPRESLRMEISKICGLLADKGKVIIFEHNPFNPITRRLVSTCEFDVGAELISTRKLINQFKKAEPSLQVAKKGYCLFFPPALKALSFFERFLRKIPLGGQYFVQFNKI
jgi:SAM-dependent methyltransferase